MKQNSLVSVIVPAYNAESFILRTLDSVLKQTYPHFEIVVVDDGSCDRTPKIVEQLIQQDSRIKLIHQNHAGVVVARNTAIAHAKGIYIAPIDADDLWHPQKLEKQVNCLDQNPELGLVYSWSVQIDECDRILGRYSPKRFSPEGKVFAALIFHNFIENGSAPLFRRSCVEKLGGYALPIDDLKRQGNEDWELFLRIAKHYCVGVVPEYLVGYRQRTSSLSTQHVAMHESYLQMMATLKQQNPEIPDLIFRWSQGMHYGYILDKSYASQDYRQVLQWIWEGVRLDWALLLRPSLYRIGILSLLHLMLPKRSLKLDQIQIDPSALMFDDVHYLNQKQSGLKRPYDRVLLHRWKKVLQLDQTLELWQISQPIKADH